MDTNRVSNVKIDRPPKRSVSIPAGTRANDPRSTGTAIRKAVADEERCKASRNWDAKALISPQAAKHPAKERVPITSCCLGLGELAESAMGP